MTIYATMTRPMIGSMNASPVTYMRERAMSTPRLETTSTRRWAASASSARDRSVRATL